MRLPRMRMTTRRWMVAVVIAGLLTAADLEAARASRRAREYRQLAVAHAAFRDLSLAEAGEYRYAYIHRVAADHRAETDLPRYEAQERALARHYDALAVKYRQAARYPWLPIEPDPPPPEP